LFFLYLCQNIGRIYIKNQTSKIPFMFSPDFHQFFKDLAANSNRDWFQAEKKRYEASVKNPFAIYVEKLLEEAKKIDSNITKTAAQSIFRIYRDVRFSQDKSPYKFYTSAVITPGAAKAVEKPGMYFEFGPELITVYGGVYQPEKEVLNSIRTNIAANSSEFSAIIEDATFKKVFGEIKGEKNARLPKEFQEAFKSQPLIANKQFYLMAEFPAEKMLDKDIVEFMVHKYKVLKPLNDWLAKAF
jgi:uncharacterized protein (TIGR02453 family)